MRRIELGLTVQGKRVMPFHFTVDIPDRSYNDSILITGGSGCGKTKLAQLFIKKRDDFPVFVIDPKGDFLGVTKKWYTTQDIIDKLHLKKKLFTPLKFAYSDITENFLFKLLRLKRDRQYSIVLSNYFSQFKEFRIDTFREYLISERDALEETNKKKSYTLLIDSIPIIERSSILDHEGINIEDFFMERSVTTFYFPLDNIEKYACASLLLEKIIRYSLRNKAYPLIVVDELSQLVHDDYMNEIMKLCINSCRSYRAFIGITQNIEDLPEYFHNTDNFLFHAKFERKHGIPRRLVNIGGNYCLVEIV